MSLDDPTTHLRSEDFGVVRMSTDHVCPCCQREIEADEDVALLTVVQGQVVRGRLETTPVVDANNDFQYEPLFVHLQMCWQDLYHELEIIAEEVEPRNDLDEEIACELCKSTIRAGETMVFAQYGEFHTSRRRPNNSTRASYSFKPYGGLDDNSSPICLSCILNVVGDSLQPWEDISENGECSYCTHARCWRVAHCRCECHEEFNYEGK